MPNMHLKHSLGLMEYSDSKHHMKSIRAVFQRHTEIMLLLKNIFPFLWTVRSFDGKQEAATSISLCSVCVHLSWFIGDLQGQSLHVSVNTELMAWYLPYCYVQISIFLIYVTQRHHFWMLYMFTKCLSFLIFLLWNWNLFFRSSLETLIQVNV